MKLLQKLMNFFRKTKTMTAKAKDNIASFIVKHKKQIRLLISIFEAIFPKGTGTAKMACLVTNVCYAVGLNECSDEAIAFIENKCQEVYDEFKASLN